MTETRSDGCMVCIKTEIMGKRAFCGVMVVLVPLLGLAQGGLAGDIKGLQGILDKIYEQLLPQCSSLISVGRAIAGFAAIWYIGVRVWRHMAHAEPVDVYPLLRPFVIGFLILVFPSVIGLINGVMKPVVTGTSEMVRNTDTAIAAVLDASSMEAHDPYSWYVGPSGDGDKVLWEQYSGLADSGVFAGLKNGIKFALEKASYNLRHSIRMGISEVLQVLYEAAALTINTLRTFNLLVLAILGPLVLGISVLDGFHHTLTHWLARYLNIFLWLPVANLFGALLGNIYLQMLQLQSGGAGGLSMGMMSTGYMVFMIIGIIGYCTVPSVAGYIVQVGGRGAHILQTTQLFSTVAGWMAGGAGRLAGNTLYQAGRGADYIGRLPSEIGDGFKQPKDFGTMDPMEKKISGSGKKG